VSAKRAGGNDPGIWHRADWRWNVLAAAFAANGEIAGTALGDIEHENRSIGEQKAKIFTNGKYPLT
jgi:hypothetical protein